MDAKSELVEELQPLVGGQREYAERAADWVLKDRPRIIQEYKTIFFCDCDNGGRTSQHFSKPKVNLPEYKHVCGDWNGVSFREGWNACLDTFNRMN